MAQNAQDTTRRWLAPITPEVVVSMASDGVPRIVKVSPRIAAWTGSSADNLVGHPVAQVFDPVIPALSVVVEDVCASGTPVRDYRVSFEDYAGVKRTVRLYAGLRPEKPGMERQLVVLRLEEVPARQEAPEVTTTPTAFHGMVGRAPALLKVIRKIEIYGPTEAPVLITGETGTGKELAARAIHECSRRRQNAFLAVNCSTLTGELLESELFGHEKGAFTGALRVHRGRFERAHGGTLFLDEVGEMPLSAQAKLLRVLEEGMIERLGGERQLAVDVRLVAATNVPLEWAVQARTFRLDLYHRLEVLRLHMPPLRERPEDMALLVDYYLRQFNETYQRQVRRLTPDALALLQRYAWPGNVRELRNVLERVYVETSSDLIGRQAFEEWQRERDRFFPGSWDLEARRNALTARPVLVTPYHDANSIPPPRLADPQHPQTLIELEPTRGSGSDRVQWAYVEPDNRSPSRTPRELSRQEIEDAYERMHGNITQAAHYLGVHKATVYRRLKALGLTREDLDAAVSRR